MLELTCIHWQMDTFYIAYVGTGFYDLPPGTCALVQMPQSNWDFNYPVVVLTCSGKPTETRSGSRESPDGQKKANSTGVNGPGEQR